MSSDKMDTHYHQQLSALMDGDLPVDQARFLLRRLGHDAELTGCWERWQLLGDALRGQAQAPAPAGFADRVVAALAEQPQVAAAAPGQSMRRGRLGLWGGGALAASVALVALFMVRQQVPEEAPASAASIADASVALAPGPAPVIAAPAAAAAGTVMVASASTVNSTQRRNPARTAQPAPRTSSSMNTPPVVASAVIDQVPVVHPIAGADNHGSPFSDVQIDSPAARPWPRAVLPQYPTTNGALNTGFSGDRPAPDFHPFEPRVPEASPAPPPAGQQP